MSESDLQTNRFYREPEQSVAAVQQEQPLAHSLLNFIGAALENPAIDVAKLKALLDMQRQVIADDAKAQFNRAFLRLQGKLPRVKKNGTLDYLQGKGDAKKPPRKYAKWEDIMEAIQPLLQEEGFALRFDTAPRQGDGGGLVVTGTLLHAAGHSESSSIPLPLDNSGGKNSLQGYGSTESYGQRYTTKALINLVWEGEDDDGTLGGVRFITPSQQAQIADLLTKTKADVPRFLQLFQVAAVENLEASQATPALNMLRQKLATTMKAPENA
jgi:hypothetical protein